MATGKATPPPRRRKKTSSRAHSDDLDGVMDGFGIPEGGVDPEDNAVPLDPVPEDSTNYAGTTIHVSWGKEHIQPLRFQGIDIGPFAMDVVVLDGETPLDAKRRAMKHLNAMAEEEIREKMPRFIQRCKDAATDL